MTTDFKKIIIFLSDAILLYFSLIITILIRYQWGEFQEVFSNHFWPFTLIFGIWLIIFYLADLYRIGTFRFDAATSQKFTFVLVINVVISIIIFYLFDPFFKLTPKTNLLIFSIIFGILDFAWRFFLMRIYIHGGWRNRLFIIADSNIADELADYLNKNPQIGYDVVHQAKNLKLSEKEIKNVITNKQIDTLIIQSEIKKDNRIVKNIYRLLSHNIAVIDLISFYETVFQKIPVNELDENWFIEKMILRKNFYDSAKKIVDFTTALILLVLFSPIMVIIAVAIKISSSGPIIYKHERTGLKGKNFIFYKFRSMKTNHNGPHWTIEKDDRITAIGKIIRYTHLDELPQLYNVLKADISFIGFRPEQKELAELYNSQLPYYEMRHLIKPGITGWAQLNYKPSASIEEAKEKLAYDLYYIKNRSFSLDGLIILKTIKTFFVNPK